MRVIINENERGLLFRNGKYIKSLKPGVNIFWGSGIEVEKVEAEAEFCPKKGVLEVFLADPELGKELQVFTISEDKRGLLFKNGLYRHMLSTGIHVFLGKSYSVDTVSLDAKFEPPRGHIESYIDDDDLCMELQVFGVADNQRGMLFLNGLFHGMLAPGQHAYMGRRFTVTLCTMETEFQLKSGSLEAYLKDAELAPLLHVYDISDQEIGLLFHRGSFLKALKPGRHIYFGEFFSLCKAPMHEEFNSLGLNMDIFLRDATLSSTLKVFDIKDNECGLLYKDSIFIKMLSSGRAAYLGKNFSLAVVKLGEEFLPGQTDLAMYEKDAGLMGLLHSFDIMEDQRGLLYKDNFFVKMLEPGKHTFLGDQYRVTLVPLDREFCPESHDEKSDAGEKSFDRFLADPDLARILHVCHIDKEHRGLLFWHGEFQKMLALGSHAYIGEKYRIEVADIHKPFPLNGHDPSVFMTDPFLAAELEILEVPDGSVALHFQNGHFCEGLSKGRYAFWKSMDSNTFQTISVLEPMVEAHVPVQFFPSMSDGLYQRFEIMDYEKGQLYYDGKFIKLLDGGAHYFWKNGINVQVIKVDTRTQQITVQAQELLTLDKVGIRVSCVCRYKISDYELIGRAILDYQEQIYVLVQLALREFIGEAPLDDLLANKEQISARLLARLKEKEAECYVSFLDAGIKDMVLPGPIKEIMQNVLKAEKQAQANVITRREEVASTRSLLNTAKLLDENQTLMHLKEMEYEERQRAQMIEGMEKIASVLGDKVTGIQIQGGDLFEQFRELISGGKPK